MYVISKTVTPLYTALRNLRKGRLLRFAIIMLTFFIPSMSCGDKNKLCETGGFGGSRYAVFLSPVM
jgi:hypothetical protein